MLTYKKATQEKRNTSGIDNNGGLPDGTFRQRDKVYETYHYDSTEILDLTEGAKNPQK